MTFLGALWHLVNFALPALGLALILPTLVRLLWWRQVKGATWAVLVRRVAVCGLAVLLAGLIVLGRDGAMLTYAALVAVSAGVVWWSVFR